MSYDDIRAVNAENGHDGIIKTSVQECGVTIHKVVKV